MYADRSNVPIASPDHNVPEQSVRAALMPQHSRLAAGPSSIALTSVLPIFPWSNGITLLKGSMSEKLLTWFDSSRPELPGINTSLVLAQARSLDSFQLSDDLYHDPRTQDFLRNLLHTDRETFVAQSRWDELNPRDISTIAHTLVRFHVLDQIVDALSFPRNPTLPAMAKIPFPRRFPEKLDRILGRLKNWTGPIEDLRASFNIIPGRSGRSKKARQTHTWMRKAEDLVLPEDPSPAARSARNDILTLWRAFEHTAASDLHTILANIELLAFSVSWFSQRNVDFPASAADLGEALQARAREGGLVLPQGFLNDFQSDQATQLFNRMKMCFHVAGTISPLVVLIPTKWAHNQIGREHLLTIFYALGNWRPPTLFQVESAAWNAVMRVVSGSNARKEIYAFLVEYDDMNEAWSAGGITDLAHNFYDNALAPIQPAPEAIASPSLVLHDSSSGGVGTESTSLAEQRSHSTDASTHSGNVSAELAARLEEVFTANQSANDIAGVLGHDDMAVDGDVLADEDDEMGLTLPGSQTLSAAGLELTNSVIDQSQFPPGVSPLTKLHRMPKPDPINRPFTPGELQRLAIAALAIDRPSTPPPAPDNACTDTDAEGETDSEANIVVESPTGPAEEAFFMINRDPPTTPPPAPDNVRTDSDGETDNAGEIIIENKTGLEGEDVFMEPAYPCHASNTNVRNPSPPPTGNATAGPNSQSRSQQDTDTSSTGTDPHSEDEPDLKHHPSPSRPKPPTPLTTARHLGGKSLPILQSSLANLRSQAGNDSTSSTTGDEDSDESDGESEVSSAPETAKRKAPQSFRRAPTKTAHLKPGETHGLVASQTDPTPEAHGVTGSSHGSKLLLEGMLKGNVQGPANMLAVKAEQMVKEPLRVEIFGLDPTADAKHFDFVTHHNVAKFEFATFRKVQELVESNYVEGRPRHHLPAARDVIYKPNTSIFFITSYADFIKLSAHDIHRIAQDRHIVVQHVPQDDFRWSRETLSKLGSLNQLREIQAGQTRLDPKATGMLTVGTLQQLYAESDKRVLLSLSLPLSAVGLVDTPRLRDLSSDRWGWAQTDGASGFRITSPPSSDTSWSTAGTQGATSWIHLDDDGFCTSTQILTGKKYWVVFYRDPSIPQGDLRGDMGSIEWSPEYEDYYDHELKGWFTAEAIEMVAGTLLLQRPNTLHYVLTMEHTITQGHHYYMSSCLQSSVHEIVHSFVRRHTVTNQLHYQTRSLLRRLLCGCVDWYMTGQWASGIETPVHVIDVKSPDGLLDLISLGNIIEFAVALDHRTYENLVLDKEERQEQEAAMTHYRAFMSWFSMKFGLLISGDWINPTYLFKRCMLSFATTVIKYFTIQHSTVQRQDAIRKLTPAAVKKMFRRHIEVVYPDLLPAFDNMVMDPSPLLYYVGPPFTVIEKTPLQLAKAKIEEGSEEFEYKGAPIYPIPDTDVSPPAAEQSAQKREYITTSPASSPSKSMAIKRRK